MAKGGKTKATLRFPGGKEVDLDDAREAMDRAASANAPDPEGKYLAFTRADNDYVYDLLDELIKAHYSAELVEARIGLMWVYDVKTGAGGGVLASRLLGHRVVCYVEREPYCVDVLKARIADGCIDDAPIWDDAGTFDGRPWCGVVDIVSAGFPCQPFSCAGKKLGGDDERNGWPDTIRIIRDVRPRVAFLENVAALVATNYFGRILGDLAESGYDARWDCFPASSVGAPHQRDRLFVVAHARRGGARGGQTRRRQ